MSALIERNGTGFVREAFKLSASEEAFRILSDGLYSDKVTAVIRELGTNAVDAHIEAGNLQPFEVHLPCSEEPFFSIRDYGTGLSHDAMMDLYSTYFGSNKRDNDDLTGCLGLGSKSPLAYTRSFTVVSFYNGYKRHYIVALNEDGIPELNYLENQTQHTNDRNGLHIQFAVKPSDINEFLRKASLVYHFLLIQPTITGTRFYKPVSSDAVTVLAIGKGWQLGNILGKPIAVMGGVPYPIDYSKINGLKPEHVRLLSQHIQIEFPIGSLSFTPSRESLSYNRYTISALKERCQAIVEEMSDSLAQEIDKANTMFQARKMASSILFGVKNRLNIFAKITGLREVLYKGTPIQSYTFPTKPFNVLAFDRNYNGNPTKDIAQNLDFHINLEIFEADLPIGNYARCYEYVKLHKECQVLYLVTFENESERKNFLETFSLLENELQRTSALPKPTRQVSGRVSSSGDTYSFRYVAKSFAESWKEQEIDFDAGGIYVRLNRYQPLAKGSKTDTIGLHYFETLINNIKKVDPSVNIIGVRPHVTKGFDKSDDWVEIWDYLANLIKQKTMKDNLLTKLKKGLEYKEIEYDDAVLFDELLGHKDKITNALLQAILKEYVVCKESRTMENFDTWLCLSGLEVNGEGDELSRLLKDFYEKYPIVQLYINLGIQSRPVKRYYHQKQNQIEVNQTELLNIIQYVNLLEQSHVR